MFLKTTGASQVRPGWETVHAEAQMGKGYGAGSRGSWEERTKSNGSGEPCSWKGNVGMLAGVLRAAHEEPCEVGGESGY